MHGKKVADIWYIAFLRGINVGGHSLIKMTDLQQSLLAAGLENVRTYIQSGNVIFSSDNPNKNESIELLEQHIKLHFSVDTKIALFTKEEWHACITTAPNWWGKDIVCKHNILIMLGEYDTQDALVKIGELKPGIEAIASGPGVLYHSVSIADFGKSTTGKLAANPIYKQMTVRNYRTATKILGLLYNS